MSIENSGSFWSARGHDLLASIVVFLVALPLCMGIAIASGLPPTAGLVAGIIGGLVVGRFGGAPLQVSGPAAGLTVMVYEIVQRSGVQVLALAIIIAGAAQIAAGALRYGLWFRAVSPAVIRGMLSGIGMLILVSQFHVMVDHAPQGSGLRNIMGLPAAVWSGLVPLDGSSHHWAAALGTLTILTIIAWKWFVPKKLQVIPAQLVGVALATAVAAVSHAPVRQVALPDRLADSIRLPALADLAGLLDGQIILAGLALAFVASAETLLCATAVDLLHRGPRTRYDRELLAQGAANMLCGVLGALPITGVIVRSAANVEAGARSRASAILHGVWLLLFTAAFPGLLRAIPTAALAAVLVYTGYKLLDAKAIRELRAYGRGEVAIYLATFLVIVAADLLTGVLVGVGLSAAKLLHGFSHLEIRTDDRLAEGRTNLWLRGSATFIRLPALAAALERIPPSTELHVHLDRLQYIDHACLDLLMNWEKQHEATGGRLVIDWDYLTAKFHREEQEAASGALPTHPLGEPPRRGAAATAAATA